MGIEHRNKRLSFIAVVNDVEHVSRVSAQPIKASDNKLVPGSQELYDGRQFSATFTTATATMDVPQGWGTTALYQVKPFVAGNVPSLAYSTILLGQPQQIVGAVPWLVVTVGPEVRYTLVIQNTTKRVLTSLKLFYLGPGGMDAQQEILPAGALVGKGATHTWANLAAGRYRWDWVETSTGKTGSQTAWCTGATLTIYGYTP